MFDDPVATLPASELAVELYGAAWHEPDDRARHALLERCWAVNGVYCDPSVIVEGRNALVAHIAGFQQRFPGHRLVLSTDIELHHGWLRFGWLLLAPDGEVALEGTDIGELDDAGRLRRIVGFF
jgi:hypothetical protein